MQLHTINWVLTKLFAILVVALLIIFQPELRRALVHLGEGPFLGFTGVSKKNVVDEIGEAILIMKRRKIGALIAIEREVGLKNYIETGIRLNSIVSSELLTTIFMPNTPLHDGAVVVNGDEVIAAACVLPLTQNPRYDQLFGMRHKAAIGITEESDAICLVVSEESGAISCAARGVLKRDLEKVNLKETLLKILQK